jgi:endonuclease/exonuclease/phosphatase family metal-dependent hydrolase
MIHDIHMHLDSFNTIISDGSKYIATIFNINARKTIHIICVYKIHSCSISTFLNNLQTIIQQYPEHCPIIIVGDFNVDVLKKNNQAKKRTRTIIFHG